MNDKKIDSDSDPAYLGSFQRRHIGLDNKSIEIILSEIGYKDIDTFLKAIVPNKIYSDNPLKIIGEGNEDKILKSLKKISKKNKIYKSYIGQGYFNTITPNVILRNVFENPGWYTSYTPYQPEIS